MRSAIRYLVILLALLAPLPALASDYWVIFNIADGANIKIIADAYDAKVLDAVSANIYLMDVKRLMPKYPVSGVLSMDSDVLLGHGRSKGGVISVKPGTTPDWYFSQPALKLIGIDQVRAKSTGKGVVIADINSAVDYSHPSLRGHLTTGYDFVLGRASGFGLDQSSATFLDQSSATFLDQSSATFLDQSSATFLDQSSATFLDQSSATFLDQSSATFLDATNPAHGHGTLVAGILAAVAPDAMIMPIRAFDDQGNTDDFTIAKAIRWAVDQGADVINMSFGTLEQSKILKDAIEYADKNGVTMVGSAGNDAKNEAQYPGAFDKVISVAATDLLDIRAGFSNFGDSIDVSAPGISIIAPYPGGYYAVVSGTSFSAPIAAGEAALVRSLNQKQNAKDKVRGRIHKIDQVNPGVKMGQGRVDLNLALQQ
jgi:subtilisin family serine protease